MRLSSFQAVLPATDIHRALTWYSEVLGLDPIDVEGDEPVTPGANSELLYDTGAGQFSVYLSEHAGKNDATALKFVVDDFDSLHSDLLAKGIVFDTFPLDVLDVPDGDPQWVDGALVSPDGQKTAWFRDSEGNTLSIGTTWG